MSQRRGRRPGPPARDERVVVGVHPVRELLRAGRAVRRVLIAAGRDRSDAVDDLLALARRAGVPVEEVDRDRIDAAAEGQVHQGVVALAPPFPYVGLKELLDRAAAAGEPALIVALDGITDPHNIGSIARTAEAVGAHGLLIPSRRAGAVTPSVEKAAAGALAHLPLARVPNLVRALDEARERGCWVVGLDADTEVEIGASNLLAEPLVVVVGSESDGLAHLTRLHCDEIVKLPMRGQVASLNASVAAGASLYEVLRRRRGGS